MNNLFKKKINANLIYWFVITIVVLLGTIIRLKGLGKWPLALDEYYLIKSSGNILKYGLPQFPNGGYYTRGVLLQYMIASLLSLGVKAEFAGRIFTVIANLITIPPLYLIAKKVGNQLIATIVVIIFCFSIWEIEFARFARMYTPFQAIFMWYVYFAFVDFTNKNFKNYKWLILLSIISFFVYEGSIFLAVFNFIPFVMNRKIDISKFLWAVIAFISSAFFNLFDFRTMNSNPILPSRYAEAINASLFEYPIKIPKVLLPFAFDNIASIILTILLFCINIFILVKVIKLLQIKNFWTVFSVLFLGLLALLNQFGLFILSFILLVFWKLFEISLSDKKILLLLSTIFITNLVCWFGFGILSSHWYILFNDFSSYTIWGVSKRLFVGFFNYPDNYYSFLNYFKTLPFLTVISGMLSAILIYILLTAKKASNQVRFLVGVLIFIVLLSTVPTLLYKETRYTFFAVPLLIVLDTFIIYYLCNLIVKSNSYLRTILFVVLTISIFFSSKDFSFYHLKNIDKEDVNYRMMYDNNFKKHLYRRWDVLNPVTFVKNNLKRNDVIMINENSLEYYLPKVDYFNVNYRHEAFIALSVENGQKERWSNAKLIYTNESLINLIESRKNTIWYLVFPEFWLKEINFYEKYKNHIVFQGTDNMITVFKFSKQLN